ncbi:MAG: OmpA family protein, partial [Bacteroidota bacterium]
VPGVSMAKRGPSGWNYPETIFGADFKGSEGRYLTFHVSQDLKAMVLSMELEESQKEDLYVSFSSGPTTWSEPVSLGNTINTTGYETSPFVTADGSTLFFTSNGHQEKGGGDIYMSKRLDESWTNWSEPVNLGPVVNTPGFDGYFNVDSKFEYCYFVSGPSGSALGDIYKIAASDIPALSVPRKDTLRVFTRRGEPTAISFEPFGITSDKVHMTSARSLDGDGKIDIQRDEPNFVYVPKGDFIGTEILELSVCDPPHSDNCEKIVVVATVEPEGQPVATLRARTPMNTPVKLELGRFSPDGMDLKRTNKRPDIHKGRLVANKEIEGEHLVYMPGNNFLGTDTLKLYRHCSGKFPDDCLVARVIVEVYGDPVAVVDPVDPVEPIKPIVKPIGDVYIFGQVTDEKTGQPVEATITYFEQPANKELGEVKTGPDGRYKLKLPGGKSYTLRATEQFHFETSVRVPLSANVKKVTKDITMDPLPSDPGQVFILENIYFDLDKTTLKPESKTELRKVYTYMKAHPNINVEIRGHTDNWSSEEYNVRLSQGRAATVVNYLKYLGVMGYRLKPVGIGEVQPIDTNDTEEGRANNRRVEFAIVK